MWNWLYINQSGILNSNALLAVTTVAVGLLAFRLYDKQKQDKVREAATVILSEIRSAAAALPNIKTDFARNNSLTEGRYLLKSQNWRKYKYILLPLMAIDEWNAVNNFYENASKYDNAILINDSYQDANAEQIWVSLHKEYLSLLVDDGVPANPDEPELSNPTISLVLATKTMYVKNKYVKLVANHGAYLPSRPINAAREALLDLRKNSSNSLK